MADTSFCLNRQIAASLRHHADTPALVSQGEVITYRQLNNRVFSTVTRLQAAQIQKGDRVAYQLPNAAEAIVLMLASTMLGAIPVPVLHAYRERELEHILNKTRPAVVAVTRGNRRFSSAQFIERYLNENHTGIKLKLIDGIPAPTWQEWQQLSDFCAPSADAPAAPYLAEMGNDDPAMMLLSSGTTGLPKPIARLNGGYSNMIAAASEVFGLSAESVYLAVLPVSHGFVINCPGILGTLSCGGAVVLAPDTSARTALALISAHQVTHTTLVPALLDQWMDKIGDHYASLDSLRYIQVGGSRISPELAAQAESRLNILIQQCYGMSEGLLCFTHYTDDAEIRHHSQGRPLLPDDEIRIVDPEGEPVPVGESGEIITRGPYTITTYFNDPVATSRSFTPEGFYRTGDLAHLDAAGNVYIDGRVRDAINRGGEKFSPEEIEELIKSHPSVHDAACVGMPDRQFGEVSCLFVVLNDHQQLQLPECRQYLEKKGAAQFKLPEKLFITHAIPRKGIGKVDRVSLSASVRQLSGAPVTEMITG